MIRRLRLVLMVLTANVVLISQKFPPAAMPAKDGFPSPDLMVADSRSTLALRAHGWTLFSLAWGNVANRGFKPRWYTWCTDAEMFDPPTDVDCAGADRTRDLSQPRRMRDMQFRFGNPPGHDPLPLLPNVLSQIYISPALAKYIKKLPALVKPSAQVPAEGSYVDLAPHLFRTLLDRNVTDLPPGANDEVAVKVAWVEVPCPTSAASPPPSLPAWDGALPAGNGTHLDPATFPRLYITPQSLARKGCKPDPRVKVPAGQTAYARNDFFWFQRLSDDPITGIPNVNPLRKGDYLMVAAIHIITHEQGKWVWATYWLSKDTDRKHLDGKPKGLLAVKGAHIAMDISVNDEAPIFNPFLEGRQEGFEHANCMRCHRAASVFRNADNGRLTCFVPKPEPEVDAGPRPPSVQTGFLWTLARRATNDCDGSDH